MKLKDQVFIVTGGGSGAGAAIVEGCVREGAQVVTMGRDEARLRAACARAGDGAHPMAGDVRDRARVKEIVDWTLAEFGRVDVLVNNAGVNVVDRSLERLSPENWDLQMDVNATGAFNTLHEVLPIMRRQGDGLVIAISSVAGTAPGVTQTVNLEEARHGIRASVISPGEINTPILDQRPVKVSDEHKARILQSEDIADVVIYVASLPPRVVISELVVKPLGQGSVE